jgi:uncharacterized protein YjbI with pentapeptide repeats
MSSSPATEASAAVTFICECTDSARSACEGLRFYKKHKGKKYCVLHYPDKEKPDFNEALKRKLEAEDFDFTEVYFPGDVNFKELTFTAPAYFHSATFSAGANFSKATFRDGTNFNQAKFSEDVTFIFATFSAESDFSHVTFSAAAHFDGATFIEQVNFLFARFGAVASFNYATFNKEVHLNSATFKDYVIFAGSKEEHFAEDSYLNLRYARIEKPERVSFHNIKLRPHWFIHVDARRFEFVNVNWNWKHIKTNREIKSLKQRLSPSHGLLAVACRNLAVNAEENHRYEEASRFRYMAMEARRLERWHGFVFWSLGWWYWLASGYGERVWRAFVVLIGVWLMAAALYTQVGFVRWEPRVSSEREAAEARRDEVGAPLRLPRALTYSLGVMTLQKPEPRPATDAAQALVMLETILGPVQAALLALAIRRKFMR